MSHGSCLVSLKLIPTVFCNSNKCKTSRGAIKLHFLSIVSDFYCRVGRKKKQQKKQHSSQSNKKQGKKKKCENQQVVISWEVISWKQSQHRLRVSHCENIIFPVDVRRQFCSNFNV